jgi:hypothetical protein
MPDGLLLSVLCENVLSYQQCHYGVARVLNENWLQKRSKKINNWEMNEIFGVMIDNKKGVVGRLKSLRLQDNIAHIQEVLTHHLQLLQQTCVEQQLKQLSF